MDEKGLGTRLQAARLAAGLTQQALCQRAGLSYSTLTKIERGAIKAPSIFTIQQLAGALGTGLDALLGLTQPVPSGKQTSLSGIRFVYFDINGCLVRFYHQAFTQVALATGAPADAVEEAFWHFNDDACRGRMSLEAFNTAFAKRLGVAPFDWEGYYLDYVEPISQMAEVAAWASEHYYVGLFTNIMPGFVTALQARELLPAITYDAVIDSSVVGALKPEKKIYEVAVEQAKVKPEEILLIDNEKPNLAAATKSGWHALWFDDFQPEETVKRIRETLRLAI